MSAAKNSRGKGADSPFFQKSSSLGQLGKLPQSILSEIGQVRALEGAFVVALDSLVTNKDTQLRRTFDEAAIDELATDIAQRGILEPLLVRRSSQVTGKYEIIAGERRYRAAQVAGLTQIPVIVKDMDDEQARITNLIENIQRQDLDPVDEQAFYTFLINQYNMSYSDIGTLIHKSASYVRRRVQGELLSMQQDNNKPGLEEGLDSEKGNKPFAPNDLSNLSQSGRSENGSKESKNPRPFKINPNTFRKFTTNLDNTFSLLEKGEAELDEKSLTQLRESVSELEQKLQLLKNFLQKDR